MGGFNHGFTLFAEECPSRHIRISDWPDDTADGAALNGVLEEHFADIGVLRVDVSGRITADRTLSISKVHHFQFQPMTEREEADWWRSTRN